MIYSPYAETMSDVADQMTDKFVSLQRTAPVDGEDALLERSYTRDITNRAASAVPVFLVDAGGGDCFDPPGGGFVTTAGSTSGIPVRVNGPLVNRGPQYFYAEFTHNDPDYFLNNNLLKPEIYLCLVGGCLADTTFLHFGMGGANHQIVTNSTRMGTGDWGENLNIDGFIEGNYQMFYGYGVTDRRIAINTQDWWTGGGETNSWESVQPDPNFCSGLCKPFLYQPEGTFAVTEYGVYNPGPHTVTYYPLLGNMVCKSWIDSVQNFDDGFGGWDWELYKTAPSTMIPQWVSMATPGQLVCSMIPSHPTVS